VKSTSLWLKIRAMFSDKFHPFVSHNWIGRKLMHSYARSVARIRTTLFVGGSRDTILPPLRTFSLDAILQSRILSTTLRHQATWPDILAARFEIAQLSGIIKSPLFFKRGSNFGIGSLKRWTLKILKHWFCFICTLRGLLHVCPMSEFPTFLQC